MTTESEIIAQIQS